MGRAAGRTQETNLHNQRYFQRFASWQQQLQGNDIAEDLGELKAALTGTTSNGMSLAEILADIGEDTTEAAEGADPSVAAKVKQLGELLSQAASSLE